MQVIMSNEIFENLLAQAKQQLSAADFENAAKSAKGLLALDESSTEASDILKAASAAIESSESNQGELSPYDEELKTKVKLRQVASDVQKALNAKKMFDATKLIEKYLVEFPNVPDAKKILADVKRAHSGLNDQREKQWEQNQIKTTGKSPYGGRRAGSSDRSWGVMLALCIFLGGVGVHRFYAGKNTSGILMFLTLGVFGIWTLIDFVLIITGNFTDTEGGTIKR